MARLARVEAFAADEIAVVHVMNRVVRRCFLMGVDEVTGKNYDHRKVWIESELKRLAAGFGIDLLAFAVMSNHFHLILRSRPDVVETWDDTEVARRWMMLCPLRRHPDGQAVEPTDSELNSIRLDAYKVKTIRARLSDISWWMRLLSQRIAQRANAEDAMSGKFWQSRYRAVRLIDEEAILACAAYVDLNPIRAALAHSIEESLFTSARLRLQVIHESTENATKSIDSVSAAANQRAPLLGSQNSRSMKAADGEMSSNSNEQPSALSDRSCKLANQSASPDSFLAPLEIDERNDPLGPRPSNRSQRCSDKGFLAMSPAAYIELLDWTARQIKLGKEKVVSSVAPQMFENLKFKPAVWCELVTQFGRLFSVIAGQPPHVDNYRSRLLKKRYHLRQATRELLAV